MQINYVWIITLLANLLFATSSNVGRPKRDILFFKNIKANLLGFNKNNAYINDNNIKILYPLPNYQTLMNVMPHPYNKQNIYKETFPKILIPSNMVMLPGIKFGSPHVLYKTAFNGRNYQAAHANFLPLYVNMKRIIHVPNYISAGVPLVGCNDEMPISRKKSVTKVKDGEVSSNFGKHESHKLKEFQDFRDVEQISKEYVQRVSTQSPQTKNTPKTMTTTPRVPAKKIFTRSPSPIVNLVQTKLSTFYAETTSMKILMEISTSTPPSFTNAPELINTNAITIDQTFISSPTPPPLPVKNVQTLETLQRMVPLLEKKDEEIKLTPTAISTIPVDYMQPNNQDEVINDLNTHNISTNIEKVNSNKPFEDTVLRIESKKKSKNLESPGDLILRHVIDVKNSTHIYIPQESDDMIVNNQSIDVYPNDSDKFGYFNRSAVILEEPSHVSVQEEGYQNQSNESEEGFRLFMPSDSEREISRGDIPDVLM